MEYVYLLLFGIVFIFGLSLIELLLVLVMMVGGVIGVYSGWKVVEVVRVIILLFGMDRILLIGRLRVL